MADISGNVISIEFGGIFGLVESGGFFKQMDFGGNFRLVDLSGFFGFLLKVKMVGYKTFLLAMEGGK